jgi:hypothetical protein
MQTPMPNLGLEPEWAGSIIGNPTIRAKLHLQDKIYSMHRRVHYVVVYKYIYENLFDMN